jgi:hypothetical protein
MSSRSERRSEGPGSPPTAAAPPSRRKSRPVEDLRLAIDCLPVATREAMLRGVAGAERVIVGAYVDGEGGMCPMLAAHRCGGRTDFLSFAKSWDRFTRAGRRAREATAREVSILVGQLQASLMNDAGVDFGVAIAEHRVLRARHERPQHEPACAADPRGEIVARRLRMPSFRGRRRVPAAAR